MKGKHILKPLCEVKDRALGRLKNYLEQRTPRQRLYIVLTALLLFAAVDIWMIASSLSGHSRPPRVEHIEVPLKP
ncbi:TraL conjugative transposon family protein [Alistipes finegoldii]|uniref:TraL conjugative transposon family protein n=1 Tax=Alistipes finegoldii TaxID=214856 RepID=UPI003A92109B